MYPNNLLNRLNRSPNDGGAGGDGTAAPAASPASPAPESSVQPSPAPQAPVARAPDPYAVTAGVKPAGLEDKFWDQTAKAIRLPELMKSYGEIQTLVTRRATEMSDPDFQRLVEARLGTMTQEIQAKALKDMRGEVPAEAKDYAITLDNETMARLPEGMRDLAQYEGDPLVDWFKGFAHEVGLGPQQFNKAFAGYLSIVAQTQQAGVASEQSRLGPNAEKRLETVANFLDANMEKRQSMALRNSLSNADAFAAVEALIARSGDPSMIRGYGGGDGMGNVGPALASDGEIRQAMRDPRYWDPSKRDPGYVKAIEGAWQRLYSKQGNA